MFSGENFDRLSIYTGGNLGKTEKLADKTMANLSSYMPRFFAVKGFYYMVLYVKLPVYVY